MRTTRYVALRTFMGFDGMHPKGSLIFRKQGSPIDAWKQRGLIAEVPEKRPDEQPQVGPDVTPERQPERTADPGPQETKGETTDNELVGVQMSYRCGDCGAVFESRAALNGHMSVHKRKEKD